MVTPQIEFLAKSIAHNENLRDIEIEIKPGSKKGDGFLGDILTVTLRSAEGQKLELIIKCAMTDQLIIDKYHIREVFDNERNFYNNIFPVIQRFQEDCCLTHPFRSVAKYYGSLFKNEIRIIALENLRISGYELFDKKSTLDFKHVEKVFIEYGKLHGAFFVYKNKYPDKFQMLTNNLYPGWRLFSEDDSFSIFIQEICNEVTTLVSDFGKEKLMQRFKKYVNAKYIFQEVIKYNGKFSTLNHGDC